MDAIIVRHPASGKYGILRSTPQLVPQCTGLTKWSVLVQWQGRSCPEDWDPRKLIFDQDILNTLPDAPKD